MADNIPIEVQVLRIGNLYLVGMGGEICCEIGMDIKRNLPGRKICTLGYSNVMRCYMASLNAHSEGSNYFVDTSFIYEITPEPRPLGLKPESAGLITDRAVELIDKLA